MYYSHNEAFWGDNRAGLPSGSENGLGEWGKEIRLDYCDGGWGAGVRLSAYPCTWAEACTLSNSNWCQKREHWAFITACQDVR